MAVYLKLTLTALFWGGTFIAGRAIAREVEPFSGSFLRFLIASVLLLILTVRVEGRLPAIKRGQLLPLALLGATGIFAYNILFFLGMRSVEAGRAALIVATNPIVITIFAVIFLRERLSPSRLAGVFLSITGAGVVISRGNPLLFTTQAGLGELLIFGCVLSWVAYSLIGRQVMRDLSPLAAVTYSSLLGTLALLPGALWEGLPASIPHYTLGQWSALLYLAIFGTVIGFLWYYEGIKKIGPSRAAVFINLVPVSAVFLSWLILGEPLSLPLFLGAALVITGAYLANKTKTIEELRRS